MDLGVETPLLQPQADLADAYVPLSDLITSQAAATHPALTAFNGNTLGVGFSGSGFLIMYFVGVSAILRSLGIINTTTRLAGSSGGSVAAAMNCGGASIPTFAAAATSLAGSCRIPNLAGRLNCNGTLDTVARTGLLAALPFDVHTRCRLPGTTTTGATTSRLFISVTSAKQNLPDTEVKVLSFGSRTTVLNACAASSFIPRFSGTTIAGGLGRPLLFTSGTLQTGGLGAPQAYDGVCTNPLPRPPSYSAATQPNGVTYTITVSALADGGAPPNFSSLVANVNAVRNPSDPAGYWPLNPTLQTQPTSVDIYPGLSGPLRLTNAAWNSYVLIAPDNDTLQYMYDLGRADAAAWVTANLGTVARFNSTAVGRALTTTAFRVAV